MNAKEAARLTGYVNSRYGMGICATPRLIDLGADNYVIDIHIAGCPEHLWCEQFRRSAVESCIDGLWKLIYPDIL
jgi:hypothetical protein